MKIDSPEGSLKNNFQSMKCSKFNSKINECIKTENIELSIQKESNKKLLQSIPVKKFF
jgi:hypothetical protein